MKPACARGQEQGGAGELVRGSQSARRHERLELFALAGLGQVPRGQRRLDVTRRERVHGHSGRRPLPRHDAQQLVDAALGGRVRAVRVVGEQARDAREREHPAVALLDHVPAGRLRETEQRRQVDAEDVVPLVLGEVEDRPAVVDADRVQHDVQAAELLDDLCDDALARAVLGQVGLDQHVRHARRLEGDADRVECRAVAVHDGDGCPGSRIRERTGPTDPTRTGDQRTGTVQTEPGGVACCVDALDRHRRLLAFLTSNFIE